MNYDDLTPPPWGADAIPAVTPALTLAAALAVPEIKALVEAVHKEITARQLYENTQTDRGAAHGPKGQAFSAWQRAIAEVFAALRHIAEGGK